MSTPSPRLAGPHRRWTPAETDFIVRTYATLTAAKQAARLPGRTRRAVLLKREQLLRAGTINAAERAHRAAWTDDQVQTVIEMLHDGLPLRKISKRIERSVPAIEIRIEQMGLTVRELRQARSIHAVAALFGVGADTILRVWIKRGWLKVHVDRMSAAERRRESRTTTIRRPKMYVTDDHLMAFVADRRAWPFWEVRRMTDPDWRETAAECRAAAGGYWMSVHDVGRRYGYSASMVQGWIRLGALKATRLTNAYFVWSTDLEDWSPPANVGLWAGRKKRRQEAA